MLNLSARRSLPPGRFTYNRIVAHFNAKRLPVVLFTAAHGTTSSMNKLSPVTYIMLAVVAWGTILALGSYLYGGTLLWQRASIVLGSTLVFVTLWLLALAARGRRVDGANKNEV